MIYDCSCRTWRAVVEVKVSTEHVEHHRLVRLPGGGLELADPLADHVQLLAPDLSFT